VTGKLLLLADLAQRLALLPEESGAWSCERTRSRLLHKKEKMKLPN
jgi:hypothetical protein